MTTITTTVITMIMMKITVTELSLYVRFPFLLRTHEAKQIFMLATATALLHCFTLLLFFFLLHMQRKRTLTSATRIRIRSMAGY